MVEYRMPSLGADMEAGFLREWRVKPGDHINRGDIIAEVETQKGIIEIEVFDEGIIGELLLKIDDKVPVGTLMTHILTESEAKTGMKVGEKEEEKVPPKEAEIEEKEAKVAGEAATPPPAIPTPPPIPVHRIRASPLAKRIAAERGIDISLIKGSGPEGAITRKDVEEAVTTQPRPLSEQASYDAAQQPTPEKSTTDTMRMAIAAAVSRSNREIPHYYLQTKVDMSLALAWLTDTNKQRSVKDRLLPVVLYVKATARALEEVPDMNAWWDNGLQRKKDIHIGFVVSLRTGGIIAPAIHDANKKSTDELMKDLSDLIPRARAMRLRSSELVDSTITVTSLGDNTVETMFGVIYPPQVALVGFGGIKEEPWAENGMVGAKPVLTISLSADHRATDGSTGSRFLTELKKYLNQPELL
ncbi:MULTISPECIES: dihydrolipoamide acetyltransferase family protein [unclassified Imperialibacter]|uniref:dihydrolipoamide acetyltransferase family protein n=1 Tax=unclassified Imperialibacter TaxID=2629706 RepID=UPI001256BAF8|nr:MULTISPECIES: dihydrolipoamide acetyltransferase family protein [unclassified Imperialibacter]CAD5265392.1 Dihydrolipoamide acetyltransferase component of pyruvate dehydrogenase complex [Imperialibacter sp. 89]CAD5270244.1 Dihydrolipoamide acetyltransferase component of pyruvate dehydrogenase complex [Imperialibacter sp. 75]VVT09867.1 Dihydrolipoamide acetyltransferase component of pyruvate dehydrogenase complex [Imperialibacter sp. EC-SDR9]